MKNRLVPTPRRSVRTPGPAADQLLFSLLQVARCLEQRMDAALEEVGLSSAKFAALTHLVEAGAPLSLSECAARMTCVRSNITQLMDRLEAEGLVRRVDDPSDRRGVKVVVTPLGTERQAAGATTMARLQKEFAKTLSGVDRGALSRARAALQ